MFFIFKDQKSDQQLKGKFVKNFERNAYILIEENSQERMIIHMDNIIKKVDE